MYTIEGIDMAKKQCPSCNGRGGWVDVILEDGTGPFEPCGWCDGTGEISGRHYYVCLGYLSAEKRTSARKGERKES